jgi:predicted  nucleic acid-binding Zn-ribbon protein
MLHLQSVERQLRTVKGRLKLRENAVIAQQRRIDQFRNDWEALHAQSLRRRKESDDLELDLKQKEERVASLRAALNTAKTNKEYAAILTQINTIKADNASLEERVLKIMQDVENLKTQAEEIQSQIDAEEKRLAEIEQTNAAEIEKLNGMIEKLSAERSEAAKEVPPNERALFERITANLDGDAMAPLEVHGKRPPHDYVCGGCFMSLNAEHANALQTKDEVRTCDSCGRILYLKENSAAVEQQS